MTIDFVDGSLTRGLIYSGVDRDRDHDYGWGGGCGSDEVQDFALAHLASPCLASPLLALLWGSRLVGVQEAAWARLASPRLEVDSCGYAGNRVVV